MRHEHMRGSSLLPASDRTLMFTNAGMVQFKDVFTGLKEPPAPAVVTVQKCVRAGGKHNDLDMVGYTPRHHTFFEMLGSFSFGAYGKREAIEMAWHYLTARLGLPAARLVATVYQDDDEAYDVWRTHIGLPADRVLRKGAADNWWSMGDGPGPCGPCTEIFWDLQNGAEPCSDDRLLEVWNLVFMEFSASPRAEIGGADTGRVAGAAGDMILERLPRLCVDTGMGLERIASVLQYAPSNYETDAFSPVISAAKAMVVTDSMPTAVTDGTAASPAAALAEPWFRIIADHLRTVSFMLGTRGLPFARSCALCVQSLSLVLLCYLPLLTRRSVTGWTFLVPHCRRPHSAIQRW